MQALLIQSSQDSLLEQFQKAINMPQRHVPYPLLINSFNPRSRGGSDCNKNNILISHLFDNSKRESYCFLKNQLQIVKERHKTFKNSNILALLRTRHTDYAFKPVTHKAKIKPCIKADFRFARDLNNQGTFQIKGLFSSYMFNPVSPI